MVWYAWIIYEIENENIIFVTTVKITIFVR